METGKLMGRFFREGGRKGEVIESGIPCDILILQTQKSDGYAYKNKDLRKIPVIKR